MISFRAKVKTLERSLNMTTSLEPYKLSVVMIVKNEAKNLLISLPALKGLADEIIILDSGSSDESEQIAKQHNAKWLVNTNWQGFGKRCHSESNNRRFSAKESSAQRRSAPCIA